MIVRLSREGDLYKAEYKKEGIWVEEKGSLEDILATILVWIYGEKEIDPDWGNIIKKYYSYTIGEAGEEEIKRVVANELKEAILQVSPEKGFWDN